MRNTERQKDILVTLVTLVVVTLVPLFRSANQFYRAECIIVSGFFKAWPPQFVVLFIKYLVRCMFIMQYLSNIYCSIYQISIAVFIKYFSNIYQISCLSHDFLFLERERGERSLEGPTTPFSRETNNNAFSSNIFQYFTTIQNDSQYFT